MRCRERWWFGERETKEGIHSSEREGQFMISASVLHDLSREPAAGSKPLNYGGFMLRG